MINLVLLIYIDDKDLIYQLCVSGFTPQLRCGDNLPYLSSVFFPGTWPKWPQHLSPWSELVSLGSCQDASMILVDGHQSLQIRFICGPLCKPDVSTQTSVEFEPWFGITGLWAYIQLDVCTRPFNLELKVCSGRVCSCSASSPPLLLCGPQ